MKDENHKTQLSKHFFQTRGSGAFLRDDHNKMMKLIKWLDYGTIDRLHNLLARENSMDLVETHSNTGNKMLQIPLNTYTFYYPYVPRHSTRGRRCRAYPLNVTQKNTAAKAYRNRVGRGWHGVRLIRGRLLF